MGGFYGVNMYKPSKIWVAFYWFTNITTSFLDNLHISHGSRQVAATGCGHRGGSGGTSGGTSGGSRGASEARVLSCAEQIAVQSDRAWSRDTAAFAARFFRAVD